MKVNQIYKTYKIPPNLQRHMLRVASLAEILSENWTGKTIDKISIVFACLFHDACKLLNFDLSRPELFEEEADKIDYWRQVQTEISNKHGNNEHTATLQVCKEIMLPTKAIQIIDNLEWRYIYKILDNHNMESAITVYSDMRIGPFGIITLEERFNELRSRVAVENFDKRFEQGRALEKTIQKNIKIDINAITGEHVNKRLEELLNLEIPRNN